MAEQAGDFDRWLDDLEPVSGSGPDDDGGTRSAMPSSEWQCPAACCAPSFPLAFLAPTFDVMNAQLAAATDHEWRRYWSWVEHNGSPYVKAGSAAEDEYWRWRDEYDRAHPIVVEEVA